MNSAIKRGFSFGLTSGVITTLGLMVGMYSGTGSKLAVIGAILTIAIADSLSDALGMHLSEESQQDSTFRSIWYASFATFVTKLLIGLSFVIPVVVFPLTTAILISIAWGILLLIIFSYFIAKSKKESPYEAIFEHLAIAIIVVIVTYYIGQVIAINFS